MENRPENEHDPIERADPPIDGEETREAETPQPRGVVATFREAFHRVRAGREGVAGGRGPQNALVSERAARNRDRTKTLFLMVGGVVFVMIVFLGLFSSSHTDARRNQAARRGQPTLGRPEDQSAQGRRPGSVTPLLNADPSAQEPPNDQLTAEDISGTARASSVAGSASPPSMPVAGQRSPGRGADRYALGNIPFNDPALEAYRQQLQAAGTTPPAAPAPSGTTPAPGSPPQSPAAPPETEVLSKASLVYVRTASAIPAAAAQAPSAEPALLEQTPWAGLPTGTRLMARLQTAVSTAVKAPVVAVIETHYEHDGEIVVPAGTRALGELQSANRSGFVGMRFHTLEMPDGTSVKIDGGAMSLSFGPIKGQVNGTNRGKQFLARALTGIGTVAAFAVGNPGGLSAPMNNSVLLRERVSQNIGIAGEQELTNLAYSQDVVVTVPGNTRFFIVLQQGAGRGGAKDLMTTTGGENRNAALASMSDRPQLPSAEELRELVALKQELDRMYRDTAATRTALSQATPR